MNIQIYAQKRNFDVQKAERFFKERGVKYQFVDLGKKPMAERELKNIAAAVGLDALIDKESKLYAGSVLRFTAGDDNRIAQLLGDMRLLRTPIVRNGRKASVGYCPDVWQSWIDAGD